MKFTDDEIRKLIADAVQEGIIAGRIISDRHPREAFKATEKRLYALKTLRIRVADNLEELQELKDHGPRSRSKDIIVYQSRGTRLDPDEACEALISKKEKTIAADQQEIECIEKALKIIEDDEFYYAVIGRYMEGKTDDEIAEVIHCDPTTIWRKRKLLVQKMAIRMYGVEAL